MLLPAYSLATACALVVSAPWWLWRMLRTTKYREGLGERMGRIPARLTRPAGDSVWVHAVSVGEVLAAGRLIDELNHALPGVQVYLSTTTRTGQALARERFRAARVFYYPLDLAFATRAWLRFLRPGLIVLVESEFWPRLLIEARLRAIPVALVNGRISDRSWPRYRQLQRLWRPLLGSLSLALAQSDRDAERLQALGAFGARNVGNLKYDIRSAAETPLVKAVSEALSPATPVVICGSTLAGEESLLLDALPTGEIFTILAPRHPERFEEVARMLAVRGVPFLRRSSWMAAGSSPGAAANPAQTGALQPGTVLLLDSIGELSSLYQLATLAVLGGGFLHPGGHNPLEPARFGVPVLMGTGYANFREIVEALQANRAVVLSDPAGLRTTLATLLAEPGRMRSIGARAQQVFDEQAGATSRTLEALVQLWKASGRTVSPANSEGIQP